MSVPSSPATDVFDPGEIPFELWDGEVVVKGQPSRWHEAVRAELLGQLRDQIPPELVVLTSSAVGDDHTYAQMPTTSMIDLETLGQVGHALADPTRRAILARLASGPAYPGDLAAEFEVGKSGMSNHLACLRGCGFVNATYEGRRVRYELADPLIAEVLVGLSRLPLGPCPQDRAL